MQLMYFYDRMKACLDFFGLKFSEMDRVFIEVTDEGDIMFTYEGTSITIKMA